jgi:hypothetical protein
MAEAEVESLERDPGVIRAARLLHQALQEDAEPVMFYPGGPTLLAVWAKLKLEVHALLCTDSERYSSERNLMKTTSKPAVAALSAFLAKDFGVEVAGASALAGLTLLLPLKMTVNAWCATNSGGVGHATESELSILDQLATNSPASKDEDRSPTPGASR